MKWKTDVKIERDENYTFWRKREHKEVAETDYYLIDAIEQGMTDEDELLNLVVETECTDEVAAGFRLAQFILDYGTFISNEVGHMIIKA